MKHLQGRALVTAMCIGQIGNLLPHVVVPAIMAQHLIPLWRLSATQAGLMASAYAVGYMLSVPVLTALTDRFDARGILFAGSLVSGLATIAFGLFADGLVSAIILWGIAGAGFGGAYMPGLKALTDRLPPGDASRSVTLYTSSFSVGVGLSFLVSQLVADHIGWRAAFWITGLGPLLMIAACLMLAPFQPQHTSGNPLDFRPVLRNRTALGYILGYGAHCFELYGMRTWLVSFWTFIAARNAGDVLIGPIALSVIVTVLSLPASILGNEAALRFGRHRAVSVIMVVSALVALAIGVGTTWSPLIVLLLVVAYGFTVPAELRRADIRHESKRRSRPTRRDNGAAFDGRLRAFGPRRMGHGRRARSGRRTGERDGLVHGFRASCRGSYAWAVGAAVVTPDKIGEGSR